MSRTWRREPIRRNRQWWDDFNETKREKYVASKAPCLIGTIDETITDARMSGDNTFTRQSHV